MTLRRQLVLLAFVLSAFLVTPPAHSAGRTIGTLRWDSVSGGSAPDVAANGSTFLAGWKPSRSRTIYATLLDQDGYPKREGIPVGTASPLGSWVRVVPLNDGYAVLWFDDPMRMVVVDASGTPGPTITITGTEEFGYPPKILSDGKRIVVVGGAEYLLARISIITLDAAGVKSWWRIPLPSRTNQLITATLAGDDVAMIVSGQPSALLLRVSTIGTIGMTATPFPGRFFTATAVGVGNDVLVVGSDSGGSSLQSILIRQNGTNAAPTFLINGGFLNLQNFRAVPVGDRILLTFIGKRTTSQLDATNLWSLILDTAGSSIDAEPRVLISGRPVFVSGIAVRGTDALLAVASSQDEGLFLRLSPTLTVEKRPTMTRLPAQENRPSIASDGVNFLAVWNAIGGARAAVVATLLDPTGVAIVPSSELSSGGEAVSSQSVAFGSGQYLVASTIGKSIALRRIGSTGVTIDGTPILIERPSLTSEVAVASDGQRFLVVWLEEALVVGAIVSPDGTWSTPRPMTSEPPRTWESWPRVAFNGKVYLLSYGASYPDPSPLPMCCSVFMTNAVRIAMDGQPIDKAPVSLSIFGKSDSPTSLAGGEGQFFAIRQEDHGSLRGVMVQADASSISVKPARTYFDWFGFLQPSVAWNGSAFTLLMRYSQFLGRMQVSLDGAPGPLRATSNGTYEGVAGEFDFWINPPAPVSATNLGGRELDLNAEIRLPSQTFQVVAHQPSELSEVRIPNAPEVNSVTGAGRVATVHWSDRSADEEGFLVEPRDYILLYSARSVVPTNTTSATVRTSSPILSVRVRSFNAAGISAPSPEVAPVAVRKRTVR